MTRLVLSSVVGLVALGATALAVSIDQRPAPTPTSSTAAITGTVVTDDRDARPLRRVRVVLESGTLELPRTVVTDESGRFVFAGLAAGNYTINATKSGYVTVAYGAPRAGARPGLAIAVRDGQRVDNLVVRMPRGAVLTGVVRQPNGQPGANLTVTVTGVSTLGGQRRASFATNTATTDDRGVYRVFGLAPGEYIIQVRARPFGPGTGGRRVTAEEIAWAQRAVSGSTAAGTGATPSAAPAPGQSVAFAPVYYPGTAISTNAAVISLSAGEEREGLDFTVEYVPSARLTGTVVSPDGQPLPRVQLRLTSLSEDPGNPLAQLMSALAVRYLPDGSFVADGLTPGRYELVARATLGSPGGGGGRGGGDAGLAAMFEAVMPGRGGANALWAREELHVAGQDIGGITMRLQPGMTVSGRVVFQATTETPPAMTGISISVSPMPAEGAPPEAAMVAMFSGGASNQVAEDGTFQVGGVTPGRYRLLAMAPGLIPITMPGMPQLPQKWSLASIVVQGRDILDRPIDIQPNEHLREVTITITDRVSELSGTVIDQAGRPTAAFPIVAFATDREFWGPGSRRITQARPATDGKYRIQNLPPGEYYLCAVTHLEPTDLADPVFLHQLVAGSIRIAIGVGEKKVQDLKLAGG